MYENGLLSQEEFASMKQDILKGNETNEDNCNFYLNNTNPQENTITQVCEKCGEIISDDDNFCTNCGNRLK